MIAITRLLPVTEDNELHYAMAHKLLTGRKDFKMKGDLLVKYAKKQFPDNYAMSQCDRIEKLHGTDNPKFWSELLTVLNWEDEADVAMFTKWLRSYRSLSTISQSLLYLPFQPFIPALLNYAFGMNADWEDYKATIAISLVILAFLLAGHDVVIEHPKEGTLKINRRLYY
jgi:hypothetical protein